MVTTRSGSRAASEVPATPTKGSTSPPNSTAAATPKGSASPKPSTPASRAARALLNRERSATRSPAPSRSTRSKAGTPVLEVAPASPAPAPKATSTPTKEKATTSTPAPPRPTTMSSRRRARQKDRVRALRAASALPAPTLSADPELAKVLREALADVLASAEADSVCPTRAPRALAAANPEKYPDWTALIPAAREVVWDEAEKGRVVVVHAVGEAKGVPVPKGERIGGEVRIRVRRVVVKEAEAEAIVVDEE